MNARDLRSSRQDGMTLPEAVLSLAVMAVMAVGFGQAVSNSRGDLKLAGAASQLATVRAAGDRYIQDNFSTLITSAAGGPIAVPISTLTALNYLPPGFPTTNGYGQAYQLYIRERSPTVLESVALTTGGTAMSASDGGKVALLLKASGGYTPVGSSTINGTNGGWTASLATYVPGASPSPSGTPAAYSIQYAVMGPTGALIRYATGNPADNQMTTTLAMNGNNVTGVGTLSGGAVSVTGTVSGNYISGNAMGVPSGGTYSMGSSYLYGDNSNTAIRQPYGFYVQDTSGNTHWQVDNGGNSWQPGNVTAASGNFNNSLATNGQFNSNTVYSNYVYSYGNMAAAGQFNSNTVYSNYVNSAGDIQAGGNGYIQGQNLTVGAGGPGYLHLYGSTVYDNGDNIHITSGMTTLDNGPLRFSDGTVQTTAASVPSGTTCGLSTNNGTTGYPCMGYNATYGCPPGYGQMRWTVNFGNNAVYYCFKI